MERRAFFGALFGVGLKPVDKTVENGTCPVCGTKARVYLVPNICGPGHDSPCQKERIERCEKCNAAFFIDAEGWNRPEPKGWLK